MYPFAPRPPEDRRPTDPDQVETVGDLTDAEIVLSDPVLSWRAKRLVDHGMNLRQARVLAIDRRVDVHDVVERMLKQGCDPLVAFDIASF